MKTKYNLMQITKTLFLSTHMNGTHSIWVGPNGFGKFYDLEDYEHAAGVAARRLAALMER